MCPGQHCKRSKASSPVIHHTNDRIIKSCGCCKVSRTVGGHRGRPELMCTSRMLAPARTVRMAPTLEPKTVNLHSLLALSCVLLQARETSEDWLVARLR